MAEETQEVEAKVIDRDLAVPAEYERWIAGMREDVQGQLSNFGPHTIASADDYRQSGRDRKAARAIIAKWDGQRKEATARYRKLLSDIKADVDAALQPLYDADAGYKAALDAYDQRIVEANHAALENWYMETQPDVADYIGFDVLWHAFAHEERWDRSSANIEKMKQQADPHLATISKELQTLLQMDMSEDERAAVLNDYCSSLDYGGAIARWNERRLERGRMRQREEAHAQWVAQVAEAQRRAQEAQQAEAMAEQEENAQTPAHGAEELAQAKKETPDRPMDTHSVMTEAERSQWSQQGEPQQAAARPQTVQEAPRHPRRIARWRVSCSEEHAREVINALKSIPTCAGEFMGWEIEEE